MKDNKNTIFIIIFLVVILFGLSVVSQYLNNPPPPKADGHEEHNHADMHDHSKINGMPALDFTFPSVSGDQISLSSFKGKNNVVLVFLNTKNPNLKEILASIRKMEEKYAADNLKGIVACMNEPIAEVREFAKKNGIQENLLSEKSGMVSMQYVQTAAANTFVIDKEGKIYNSLRWNTAKDFETNVDQAMQDLLKGIPPTDAHPAADAHSH